MSIDEIQRLAMLHRKALARVRRRMQEFGPRHYLTIQATWLSINIRNKVEN